MSGQPQSNVVLAVHGGAGIILRDKLCPELELQYRSALKDALLIGYDVLRNGSSRDVAVDAAVAAVKCMERCPLFNAGKGSVFASDEKIRMDASIMGCCLDVNTEEVQEEQTESKIVSPHQVIQQRRYQAKPHPKAGSIAGVSNIEHPILLARQVMERTPHVMLIGQGAEDFARSLPPEAGVTFQPDEYFWTEKRWKQLLAVKEMEKNQRKETSGPTMMIQLDHSYNRSPESSSVRASKSDHDHNEGHKFGTVGCVALYRPGHHKTTNDIPAQLASATSTGGMTNQRYHRVGDSPIIGSGTYADSLCAVSCTGHGEWFLRCVAAHDVVKRLEYKYSDDSDRGLALQKAVDEVIFGTLMGDGETGKHGGDGGLIALDRDGNFVSNMNCSGMYHGWICSDGTIETRIFWDEHA